MDKMIEIAKMIDHSILHPTFTDNDLKMHCEIAQKYEVATVCVKPYHTRMAAELLMESSVAVCSVIGFPQGNSTIAIKKAETLQVIQDGAKEVDMVVNIGKVIQNDWNYINTELGEINSICLENDAILKVIFETDFIKEDSLKIKLCQLCSDHKVGFVKTSTGYGFVKGDDGKYSYQGATDHDLILMRKYSDDTVQIKAAGGIRDLAGLLRVKDLGVTRVGATATSAIMEAAKERFMV